MKLLFTLNGRAVAVDADPDQRAVDLLRGLDAFDVKEGCGTGECGACSVLVDGVHKLSCLLLAAQLEGRELTTAAGLGSEAAPHPIQRAFAGHGAVQCGFCTPGMTIAAAALLAENPAPTRQEVRRGLSGNLCRCTGYVKIVDAVRAAALELADIPADILADTPVDTPVGIPVDVSADVPADDLAAASTDVTGDVMTGGTADDPAGLATAKSAGGRIGAATSAAPGDAHAPPAGAAPAGGTQDGALSAATAGAGVRAKGRPPGKNSGGATNSKNSKAGDAA